MVHPQVVFHGAIKFFVVHLMLMELSLLPVALTLLPGYVIHICSWLSCNCFLLTLYPVSTFHKSKCKCFAQSLVLYCISFQSGIQL
jgi:hypothetical protein